MNLKENEHYYFENGLMVFTEKYHLERGYCCKSGCRHCPYGFNKAKPEKEPQKNSSKTDESKYSG